MRNCLLLFMITIPWLCQCSYGSCIHEDRRLMDGVFNPFNNPTDQWSLTSHELQNLTELFFKRFKRAHLEIQFLPRWLNEIIREIGDLKLSTKSDFQIFTSTPLGSVPNGLTAAKANLKEYHENVVKLNHEYGGVIAGVYVDDKKGSWQNLFLAINEIFTSMEDVKVPVGVYLTTCSSFLSYSAATISGLQNLQFITCEVKPREHKIPERQADQVLTICDDLTALIRKQNITADLYYRIAYASEGVSTTGIAMSKDRFRRFWCRIFSRAVEYTQFTIVLASAFDKFPDDNLVSSLKPEYHYGWWKRVESLTNTASAFVEKVELDALQTNKTEGVSSSKQWTYEIGLYVSGVIGVLLLAGIAGYFGVKYYKEQGTVISSSDISWFENGTADANAPDSEGQNLPYDSSYELKRFQFNIDFSRLLGEAEHCFTYFGKLKNNNEEVAVKIAKSTEQFIKDMLSEIKLMIHASKHENILNIVGAFTSEAQRGNLYLFLEFCELDTIQEVLKNNERLCVLVSNSKVPIFSRDMNGFQMLADKWAREIAAGMHHLCAKTITHGDMSTRNVLVNSNGAAKIKDYGLVGKFQMYNKNFTQHIELLPWRWMAPESLRLLAFGHKTDVWAYGITLFEIYSKGKLPYPGVGWDPSFLELLESGYINEQPEYSDSHM